MLGRKVTGILAPQPARVGPNDRWYIAWFTDEQHQVVGVMALDHALAVHLASAFALIPVAIAANLVKSGRLDDTAADNLHECCNMCTKFFTLALEGLIVLGGVGPNTPVAGRDVVPPAARALLAHPAQRLDMSLTVDGYGAGALTVVTV